MYSRSASPRDSAASRGTTFFVDESKNRSYVLVAAEISQADLDAHRAALRALVLKGQRRLHFTKESDSRRRAILAVLAQLELRIHIFESSKKKEALAREDCLVALVARLRMQVGTTLVLERDASIERSDHRILYRELSARGLRDRVDYHHDDPHREPLLWIPDAVAWCRVRGGDWLRRIEPLLGDEATG